MRYVHTNLIAHDWRSLARFYEEVFGCTPVPPERDLQGPEVAAGTAIPGATLRGVHLRLPGYGPDGPTLELFQYDPAGERFPTAANRPGFGHIAFAVDSVKAVHKKVVAAGGAALGEIVSSRTADGREVEWAYLTDPEGNILELQTWRDAGSPVH